VKVYVIHSISYTALMFSTAVFSEVNQRVSIGITHTDNVEMQSNSGVDLDNVGSLTRSGVTTEFSLLKQNVDYTGGYIFGVRGLYNKGLNGAADISNLELSASKLSILNPDWLMRSKLSVQQYHNDDLQVNGFDGIRFENTFGYLKSDNSGTDITLEFVYESHGQDEDDSYEMQRSGVKLSHYLSHKMNAPYWALHADVYHNNASGFLRNYNSFNTAVEYRQWSLGSFVGTVSAQWQHDDYNQLVRVSSTGRFLTPRNANRNNGRIGTPRNGVTVTNEKRLDDVYRLQVNLNKALKKDVNWQLSTSVGHYDSTIVDISESFYQVTSRLQWVF